MCVHEPQAAAVAVHKAPRRSQLARWVVRQTRFLETKTAGEFIAELWGTALIVLFGCGVVCAALSGAQAGIWQVAVVWWLGVSLAIYTTAHVSGAHLNPAITIALATLRDFEWSKVPHYIAAQLLGGILGGALNLMIFNGIIHHYERSNGIVRGEPESILTAAAFGEYFPNPYLYAHTGEADAVSNNLQACSLGHAFLVEAWGTALLAFVIFALTDPRNTAIGGGNAKVAVPFMIGALVGVNLSLYAPITQAGWNPARDFGPRIVAAIAGWGDVAIAGPRDGFWVYILAPIVGAVCGGGFYDLVLGRSLGNEEEDEDDEDPFVSKADGEANGQP
eukprot:PRCOL_00000989-RA